MKYEINFAEMAEIMNAVVKAEEKAEIYRKAVYAYEDASFRFDGTVGTPEAQRMINTYAEREKARRAFKGAVLKAGKMLFDEKSRNYNDVDFFRFAEHCDSQNIERLIFNLRCAAAEQFKQIKF